MSKRCYLAQCSSCQRWYSVATLAAQRIARLRGTCPGCTTSDDWRARVYVQRIERHVERIVAIGTAAPEDQRDIWRRLYRKRQRQHVRAKERLEGIEV